MSKGSSGFISFSAVASASKQVSSGNKSTSLLSPVYTGSDSELAQSSKKLIKKDSTTKLKALNEVIAQFKIRGDHLIGEFLPYFVYVYSRLCTENDTKIREQLNTLLQALVTVDKQQLTPYMKLLFGHWWSLICDPMQDVSARAEAVFNDAIPPKKRQQVLFHLAPYILQNVYKMIQQTAETLSDMTSTTQSEAEDKYVRVMISNIISVSKLISSLTQEQNEQLVNGIACEDLDIKLPEQKIGYITIINHEHFTQFINSKYDPIRKASYEFFSNVSTNATFILEASIAQGNNNNSNNNNSQIKVFTTSVLSSFDDNHVDNIKAALDMFITLSNKVNGIWDNISIRKQLIPKLKQIIKKFPSIGMEYVLSILGSIPVKYIMLYNVYKIDDKEYNKTIDEIITLFPIITDYSESSKQIKYDVDIGMSVFTSVTAHVCIIEVATLLLLRRNTKLSEDKQHIYSITAGSSDATSKDVLPTIIVDRLKAIANYLIISLTEIFRINGVIIKSLNKSKTETSLIPTTIVAYQPEYSTESTLNNNNNNKKIISNNASAVSNKYSGNEFEILSIIDTMLPFIIQLQKGTQQEINLNRDSWNKLLWNELSQALVSMIQNNLNYTLDKISNNDVAAYQWVDSTVSSLIEGIFRILHGSIDISTTTSHGVTLVLVNIFQYIYHTLESSTITSTNNDSNSDISDSVMNYNILSKMFISLLNKKKNKKLYEVLTTNSLTSAPNILLLTHCNMWKNVLSFLSASITYDKLHKNDELTVYIVKNCINNIINILQFYITESSLLLVELEQIISNILDTKSLSLLVIFLHALTQLKSHDDNIVWSSNVIQRLLNEVTTVISNINNNDKRADTELKLQLLMYLSTISSFSLVKQAIIMQLKDLKTKFALWFMSTYLANTVTMTTNELLNDIALLFGFANDQELLSMLKLEMIRLFYQRDSHNNQYANSRHEYVSFLSLIHSSTSNNTTENSSNINKKKDSQSFNVILSWYDIQNYLLNKLPSLFVSDFIQSIDETLANEFHIINNNTSESTEQETSNIKDDDIVEDTNSEAIQGKRFGHRKLARHIIALIEINDNNGSSNIKVFITRYEYWKSLVHLVTANDSNPDDNDRDVIYILNCLQSMIDLKFTNFALHESSELYYYMMYFLVALLTTQQRRLQSVNTSVVACKLLNELNRHLVSGLSESQGEFVTALFHHIIHEMSSNSSNNDVSYSILSRFLDSMYSISSNSSDNANIRKRLQSPDKNDTPERGHIVQYIVKDTTITTTSSSSVSVTSAKILAIHNEAGVDNPYYSLQLLGDKRELQTEWYKIIVNGVEHEAKDEITWIAATDNTDKKNTTPVNDQKETGNVLFDTISQWIDNQLDDIISEILLLSKKDIVNNPDLSLLHKIHIVCKVFTHFNHYFVSLASTDSQKYIMNASRIRGLIEYLSSNCNPFTHYTLWNSSIILLSSLTRSKTGIGHGNWLSSILHNYSKNLEQVIQKLTTRKEVYSRLDDQLVSIDLVLSSLCNVFSTLLNAIQWNKCYTLSTMLLPYVMKALPSTYSNLTTSIVLLMQSYYMSKHYHKIKKQSSSNQKDKNNDNNDVDVAQPRIGHFKPIDEWEVDAFNLLLTHFMNLSTEDNIGIDTDVALKSTVCNALHYCLLSTDKKSLLYLLQQSQLESMLLQLEEISVIGSNNGKKLNNNNEKNEVYRLTAYKVLDMWITLISSEKIDKNADKIAKELMDDEQLQHQEETEATIAQEEALEYEKDQNIFKQVMHEKMFEQMLQRFSFDNSSSSNNNNSIEKSMNKLDLNASNNNNNNNNVGDDVDNDKEEYDDEESDDDDNEDSTIQSTNNNNNNNIDRASPMAKNLSNKQRHFSTKRVMHEFKENDPLGSLFLWLLCLQRIDSLAIKHWSLRARCGNYLNKSGLLKNILFVLTHISGNLLQYPDISALLQRMESIDMNTLYLLPSSTIKSNKTNKNRPNNTPNIHESIEIGSIQQLAIYAIYRTICSLPAMFRHYWNEECNRQQKLKITQFIEDRVRLLLMTREIQLIATAYKAGRWNDNQFILKGSIITGEVMATFLKDETKMEVKIKLPSCYPLKNVEVTCTSKIGVPEQRWRRWVLQMTQLLSMQDGSVVDAAMLWKYNIEKELEGVEPCPICYSIVHVKTMNLPSLVCPTCHNKYHPICLHTWFKSSGKSKCCICQQPFFGVGGNNYR